MTEIKIERNVFNDIYIQHIDNYAREQIFFGGSASGKSVFLAQRDIIKVLRGGRNVLVCRQVGKTLRGSVVQEVRRVISDWGLGGLLNVNKTDGTVTCRNGYQIVFAGLDDVEKMKSIVPQKGVFTDIRIEEATEVASRTVKQLKKRQRGGSGDVKKTLTLTFNPIMRSHWIHKQYFSGVGWRDGQTEYADGGRLSILKTTYKDNRFLTPDDIHDLESEADKYFYNVYTLGNWGILGDVIFKNWEVRDLSDMRAQFTNPRNGLDFGFSVDPAAIVATHYDRKRKTIYVYDELYERGLTNDMLAERAKRILGGQYVVCDSAEPKSIEELRRLGVRAGAAKKGKDSIVYGIQWLQQQKIIVDKSCVNMQNELSQYQWKRDRSGEAMRMPVDKNNHLIDALRYAYEEHSNAVIAWEW